MSGWQSKRRSTITPIIMVRDAVKTIEFAEKVFGAEKVGKPLFRSDGSLWNAEIRIGDSTIMFNEPPTGHEMPAFIYVHVPDADETFSKAIAQGAEEILKPNEQFYGEYDGGFKDPQNNIWWVSTHRKELSPDEIEKGARAFEKQMSNGN